MNFEKVKEFVLDKKVYLIGAIILVVGFYGLKKGDHQENAAAVQDQVMQSSISSSGATTNTNAVTSSSSTTVSKTVTCDISGAVKHQGVYTLKNGARLQELIEAAGGTTARAQLKAINRATLLKDQDKIHIPYKGEKVENVATTGSADNSQNSGSTSSSSPSNQGDGTKINLNTANVAELQKLTGIGQKKAEQIIAYREQNGSFKKIEDLMQVSGIGEKTFASLKDQLAV